MIILGLFLLGLCLGSFVNALVWRVHEQESGKKSHKLSVINGRSMCPNCHHELAARDLIPLVSWLSLGGKCRYCKKPIGYQYPLVEALTGALFVACYVWWPIEFAQGIQAAQIAAFGLWLLVLTGLIALAVYDIRWMLLPNRIIYPLAALAAAFAAVNVLSADNLAVAALNLVFSVAIGGGVFWVLFQISGGKWIGGGDVRLGWLLGLLVLTPSKSLLVIFLASILGCLVSVPLMLSKRLKGNSLIPFGPFLIMAGIVTVLFGNDILHWYQHLFLPYSL